MQKKSNSLRDMIVVGFALFSMFFGAGNVVFPPYLGMEAGPQWLAGFSAYFIADIGLALLGMFALLRVGSSEAVISRVGKVPAELLMCAIILCIGPMVAIPRTSATTFEMAISPNLSGVSPVLFSVLFFALILVLCIKESAVVDIVGKILTPLLLLGLFAIIIKGIITPVGEISAWSAAPPFWRVCSCWRCTWVLPIWAPLCPASTTAPSAAPSWSWPSWRR